MKSGSTEWCAMELAKDNFAHNIPKDWITAKVWEVICKNPVYKDYVKENARYVNKLLHKNVEKTIDKPSKINYINNTNETKTTNSKGDKTMKLNNAEISANIEQLTDKVNELLERIAILEGRKTETHNFKKLREKKEEAPKAEPKKVAAPKKTAVTAEKRELLKLQKKARIQENALTKKQMAQYTKLITEQCRKINKKFDKTDKSARSIAFVKARIYCLKKARAI